MRFIAPKSEVDQVTSRQKEITLIADNAAEEIMITAIRDSLRDGKFDRWYLSLTDGRTMIVDFPDGTKPQLSGNPG